MQLCLRLRQTLKGLRKNMKCFYGLITRGFFDYAQDDIVKKQLDNSLSLFHGQLPLFACKMCIFASKQREP